jgi:MinD superfamily P-loop ATPase
MKQLVVLSGKGGTGKTTITAAFAALAGDLVLADCDVDAADLHLILDPKIEETHEFHSMPQASIDREICVACGDCIKRCRFDAISEDLVVDPISCEGCRLCIEICPVDAVRAVESSSGEWFVSSTKYGPLVHARLGVAQENSGKLVTKVRERAREIAEERESDLILVDGPPGIGCPVISSLSGTDMALVVVEPTLSGIHDMERVVSVARHFGIQVACSVNKFDVNYENFEHIETWCTKIGVPLLGRIPFDRRVTEALIRRLPVVEYTSDGVARDIEHLWSNVRKLLNGIGRDEG